MILYTANQKDFIKKKKTARTNKMNSVKLQGTQSRHKNQLHFFFLKSYVTIQRYYIIIEKIPLLCTFSTHDIYFVTGSLYLLISFMYFSYPPPTSHASGNHLSVISITLFLFCHLFICCIFRFHI